MLYCAFYVDENTQVGTATIVFLNDIVDFA